jgi:ABC-type transporter Mla MlaB component
MANSTKKKQPRSTKVVISGDATVATAAKWKRDVSAALAAATDVEIVLQDITSADVTLLQLLCSAHRTAADQNKNLTMTGGKKDPVARLLRNAGFLRHLGCLEQDRKTCLWIETLQR